MPLSIAPYIAAAQIETREVKYAWDDWGDMEEVFRRDSDELLAARVVPLSHRARIALTNGIAEWLVYRFRVVLDTASPFEALEAAWAGVIDRKYVLPLAPTHDNDDEQLSGPVMGVLRRGFLFVSDIIDLEWDNGETIDFFLRLTNLTRYVLPKGEEFEVWLDAVLERLTQISPRLPEDLVGEVVPREALDTQRPFNPETADAWAQGFLASLDFERNPYLAPPDTMLEWGFQGKPYSFDPGSDRRARKSSSE